MKNKGSQVSTGKCRSIDFKRGENFFDKLLLFDDDFTEIFLELSDLPVKSSGEAMV